jgi:hypothetical protein
MFSKKNIHKTKSDRTVTNKRIGKVYEAILSQIKAKGNHIEGCFLKHDQIDIKIRHKCN